MYVKVQISFKTKIKKYFDYYTFHKICPLVCNHDFKTLQIKADNTIFQNIFRI